MIPRATLKNWSETRYNVSGEELDELLATGCRRLARHFYRRAEDIIITKVANGIAALRIPLSRFADTAPDTLHHFITASPDFDPVRCLEVDVHAGAELVAASYFNVGATATSAVVKP